MSRLCPLNYHTDRCVAPSAQRIGRGTRASLPRTALVRCSCVRALGALQLCLGAELRPRWRDGSGKRRPRRQRAAEACHKAARAREFQVVCGRAARRAVPQGAQHSSSSRCLPSASESHVPHPARTPCRVFRRLLVRMAAASLTSSTRCCSSSARRQSRCCLSHARFCRNPAASRLHVPVTTMLARARAMACCTP